MTAILMALVLTGFAAAMVLVFCYALHLLYRGKGFSGSGRSKRGRGA